MNLSGAHTGRHLLRRTSCAVTRLWRHSTSTRLRTARAAFSACAALTAGATARARRGSGAGVRRHARGRIARRAVDRPRRRGFLVAAQRKAGGRHRRAKRQQLRSTEARHEPVLQHAHQRRHSRAAKRTSPLSTTHVPLTRRTLGQASAATHVASCFSLALLGKGRDHEPSRATRPARRRDLTILPRPTRLPRTRHPCRCRRRD